MPEEERLELTSAVMAENHGELDRLADSLDDVDDAIRQAGSGEDKVKIDVEVTGIGRAIGELEALESELDEIGDRFDELDIGTNDTGKLFDDLNKAEQKSAADFIGPYQFQDKPDTSAGGGSGAVADGDGSNDLFSVDNIDLFDEHASPFLDYGKLGERGGETSRINDILTKDISELVEFDKAVELAIDPDSDVDRSTLSGITGFDGPEAFSNAVEKLNAEGITRLGRDKRTGTGRLKDAAERLRFTMGAFHQILAGAIPIFAVFVGALPAAITGLVALGGAALIAAGALAAIGGLGIMGMSLQQSGEVGFGAINEELNGLKNSFIDSFAPLSRTFAPTLRDAITQVDMMIGPLATASSQLTQFKDDFDALVGGATNAIPSLVDNTLRFAHATMPMLTGLSQFLGNQDIFGFLATQLANAWPMMVATGKALVQIMPAIIRVSQGFFMVASGLLRVFGIASMLINQFPLLGQAIGFIAAGFLTLVGVSTMYYIATTKATGAALTFAATMVTRMAPALQSAILQLTGYAISATTAYWATVALVGAITLGIGAVAGLASGFGLLSNNISSATGELRKFANTGNSLGGDSFSASGGTRGAGNRASYYDNSTTVIEAGDKDSAARQQYSSDYEHQQHVDSIFGA